MPVEGFNANGDKIQFLRNNLVNQHLKVSRLDALNDIFEFRNHNLSDGETRELFEWVINDGSKERGIICFSRIWQSPVMWGHYGDSNRGVCLGFDIDINSLAKIKYIRKRVSLMPSDVPTSRNQPQEKRDEFLDVLLETKYKDWKYEKEMRLPIRIGEEEANASLVFAPFHIVGTLKKIYVGAFSKITKDELEVWLGDYPHQVEILKTRAAFQSFEICTNQLGFSKSPI